MDLLRDATLAKMCARILSHLQGDGLAVLTSSAAEAEETGRVVQDVLERCFGRLHE
jgi:hypothetical protein